LLNAEGKCNKLSFLGLHSNEYKRPENNKDTHAYSWTHFDFASDPLDVEVENRKPFGEDLTTKLRCDVYAVNPLEDYCKLGGRQVP
jgi:hypothetical protein